MSNEKRIDEIKKEVFELLKDKEKYTTEELKCILYFLGQEYYIPILLGKSEEWWKELEYDFSQESIEDGLDTKTIQEIGDNAIEKYEESIKDELDFDSIKEIGDKLIEMYEEYPLKIIMYALEDDCLCSTYPRISNLNRYVINNTDLI